MLPSKPGRLFAYPPRVGGGIDCVPGVPIFVISIDRFFSEENIPPSSAARSRSINRDARRSTRWLVVAERSPLLNLCEWSSPSYVLNMMAMTGKWDIYAG